MSGREVSAGVRLAASGLVGLVVAVAVWLLVDPRYAVGVGWSVACLCWLLWAWIPLRSMNPVQTREHAVREDSTRAGADLVILLAAAADRSPRSRRQPPKRQPQSPLVHPRRTTGPTVCLFGAVRGQPLTAAPRRSTNPAAWIATPETFSL